MFSKCRTKHFLKGFVGSLNDPEVQSNSTTPTGYYLHYRLWLLMLSGDGRNRRFIVLSSTSNHTSEWVRRKVTIGRPQLGAQSKLLWCPQIPYKRSLEDSATKLERHQWYLTWEKLWWQEGLHNTCLFTRCAERERHRSHKESHCEQSNINQPSGSLVWQYTSLPACKWQYRQLV